MSINPLYIKSLNDSGLKTFQSGDDLWVDYVEIKSVIRIPAFNLKEPKEREIIEVFKNLNPLIISYATKVDELNTANGYLYASSNKNYDIDKLDKNGRRDARRAIRCFDFDFISWDKLLLKGYKSYKDTRSRNNLSDFSINEFINLINQNRKLDFSFSLAATDKISGELGGFLIMTIVDDWIEVSGAFSDNSHLQNCPNNGLFHFLQEKYLKNGTVKIISYGYSSMQKASSIDGLSYFKERIGFSTIPIRRVFVLKPNMRFFVNPITNHLLRLVLNIFPKNRSLNKMYGIFTFLIK